MNNENKEILEKKNDSKPLGQEEGNYPLNRVVPPHNNVSRDVTEEDLDYLAKEAKVLYDICLVGAHAMAYPQIEVDDPMNFYVTLNRKIVINPKIIQHSNYTVKHKEGCVTFAGKQWVDVDRWQKCEIEYVTIMVDPDNREKFKLSGVIKESLSGMDSFIAQHEINHLRGVLIYPIETQNEKS